MQYSKKGFWISQVMAMGLVAILVAYSFLIGTGGLLPYLSAIVLLVCGSLTFRAIFYMDEIQKAKHSQIWAHGALVGLFAATLLIPFVQMQSAFLDGLVDMTNRRPHEPKDYFVAGFTLLLVAQIAGSLVVQFVMWLRRGA